MHGDYVSMNTTLHISRKSLLLISLLCVVLVSSLFTYMFVNDSSATSLENTMHVKTETELKNAINNVSSKETTIALDNDITLTQPIVISANKDIKLVSNKASGFYKLIGVDGSSTITVESNGALKLDGVIITHKNGDNGRGVDVLEQGQLILYRGEISGNTNTGDAKPNTLGGFPSKGGGVYIEYGIFEMYGGKISNNEANAGNGGGVYNLGGTFKMESGEISDNRAIQITTTGTWCGGDGGGVFNGGNSGNLTVSGGKIFNNRAANNGGGVFNIGSFILYGGAIYSNTAVGNGDRGSPSGGYSCGGGVYNINLCSLRGGTITGNTADWGGGVYYAYSPPYILGVTISGNTAKFTGNDIYPDIGSGDGSSGGNDGSSDGNNKQSTDGFGVRATLVICVIIIVTMNIAMIVLFFYFKKKIAQVEAKLNTPTKIVRRNKI